jgi:hypothetical protein
MLEQTNLDEFCDVELSDPAVNKGGMFSSGFVVFNVTTNPLDWTVIRRFEDFTWLRNVLATIHPASVVPILPKEVN